MELPEIKLPFNEWVALETPYFAHATDGIREDGVRTDVRLLATDTGLRVAFECLDNPYLDRNTYTEHNTDLWRQEVFEVFIAAGAGQPQRYLEVEINPNNALFTGWMTNESGVGPLELEMIPYGTIAHQVTRTAGSWAGELTIPWSLLGPDRSTAYRLNFYRIVLHSPSADEDWECSTTNCHFLCWSATHSGAEPAFHRPSRFGKITIPE